MKNKQKTVYCKEFFTNSVLSDTELEVLSLNIKDNDIEFNVLGNEDTGRVQHYSVKKKDIISSFALKITGHTTTGKRVVIYPYNADISSELKLNLIHSRRIKFYLQIHYPREKADRRCTDPTPSKRTRTKSKNQMLSFIKQRHSKENRKSWFHIKPCRILLRTFLCSTGGGAIC